MEAESYGFNWVHTRDYGNRSASSYDGANGFGWYNRFMPRLVAHDDVAVLIFGPLRVYHFDKVSETGYLAQYFFKYLLTLKYNAILDRYELKTPRGRTYLFAELTPGSALKFFIGTIEPNGDLTTVDYEATGSHRLVSILRDDSGVKTGFFYSYSGSSTRLSMVTLQLKDVPVRRAVYTYYSGESGGTTGDLKTASVEFKNQVSGIWESLGTSYNRYYVTGESGGFAHGLKFVVGMEAYARMLAAGLNPAIATDAEVATYADYHFQYDAQHRVALERTSGGAYTYTFVYSTNSNSFSSGSSASSSSSSSSGPWIPPATGAFNRWRTKTVVTMPDNTEEVAYCNPFGQVLLKVFRAHEGEWCRYWRYDDTGRVVLRAQPSAVAAYTETQPQLATLHGAQGAIRLTELYADASGGGGPGRVKSVRVREGEVGGEVMLRELQYVGRAADGRTYYFISQDTRYVGASGGSETAVTTYGYTWHTATPVVNQRTTTLPAIPTAQNGSNTANEIVEIFNTYGYRTSLTDERGNIQQWTWDVALAGFTQHVVDSAGLGLISDYTLDPEGRTTRELGPEHTIDLNGTETEIRRAQWTVYLDAAYETRTAGGYLRTAVPSDTGTLINPVSIARTDRAGRVIEQIVAERASTTGPLSAGDTFSQTQFSRWSKATFDNQSHLTAQRLYHHIPAIGAGTEGFDYAETRFAYDVMGRRIETISPAGTITRSVLNTRGLLVAAWVGTNNAGATLEDPTGGGEPANNMVQTEAREYDRGAPGGDSLLTEVLVFTGPAEARSTTLDYDYRGRRTVTRGEHGFRETYVTDNVNRVTLTERWNDEGVTPLRVAKNETLYDKLGRVYRTIRYSVDPVTGDVGVNLGDDTWFDPAGNVMKRRNPEDAGFEKLAYDGAGRVTHRYAGFNSVTASYSEAQTVTNDTIFDQTDYIYDPASNTIQEVRRERFHNTSGLGALGGPTGSTPNARVLYMMRYPDAIGRLVASANYGTAGGTTPTRPATIPSRSDDVLVTTTEFNGRGEVARTIDPKATVTVQEFDDAGRLVKTIENYEP